MGVPKEPRVYRDYSMESARTIFIHELGSIKNERVRFFMHSNESHHLHMLEQRQHLLNILKRYFTNCNGFYIGSTIRNQHDRIKKHFENIK